MQMHSIEDLLKFQHKEKNRQSFAEMLPYKVERQQVSLEKAKKLHDEYQKFREKKMLSDHNNEPFSD